VDVFCHVASTGPPSRVVLGWKGPGLNERRATKTRPRLGNACTGMPNLTGTVRSRLKHLVSGAEVFTNRLVARVCLRLPVAAG
jgi:hypothetical protein